MKTAIVFQVHHLGDLGGHLHTTHNILVINVDELNISIQEKRVLFLCAYIKQRVKREWKASRHSRRRRQDTLLHVR